MPFLINNIPINDRPDWRHTLQPGPLSVRRREGFPGDKAVYLIKGVQRPPALLVSGFLEAPTSFALDNLVLAEMSRRELLTPLVVEFEATTFLDADLADFSILGPVTAFGHGGDLWFKQEVRYVFELLNLP